MVSRVFSALPLGLVLLTIIVVAGCRSVEPTAVPEPGPLPAIDRPARPPAEVTPIPPVATRVPPLEMEPPVEPLYTQTADELRRVFTNAFYDSYAERYAPADAQQLGAAAVRAFLVDLESFDPSSAESARRTLGPLLSDPSLVGFVLPDANPDPCAQYGDVLYVPIPERRQAPDGDFAFDGIIIRDECGGVEAYGLQCAEVPGADGEGCACVCEIGPGPATPCEGC